MSRYEDEQKMVIEAVAKFPAVFGLRAFPGKTYRVSLGNSFVSEGVVQIVVQTKTTADEQQKFRLAEWADFGRDAADNVLAQIVKL